MTEPLGNPGYTPDSTPSWWRVNDREIDLMATYETPIYRAAVLASRDMLNTGGLARPCLYQGRIPADVDDATFLVWAAENMDALTADQYDAAHEVASTYLIRKSEALIRSIRDRIDTLQAASGGEAA